VSRLSGNKRAVAIVLGAVLVLLVVLIAATSGIGKDDPSGDSVAVVDGEQISKEQFDRALAQAAAQQGGGRNCQPPAEDDPQFAALRDAALNTVLDSAWIQREAAERGVEVSDREVQEEFEKTKEQNFQTEKEYEDYIAEACLIQADVDERVKLQVLSTKIQDQVNADAGEVSDEDAEKFYEANKAQFAQPEQRNIRIVLNEDPAKAQQAADQLNQDNSPQSWNKVAAGFSTDASSKDTGGVREAVTEGVFPEAVDAQIFDASEGEVIGPIETESGTYVFQVDAVTEATTTPLAEARTQIDQQLAGQIQQEAFGDFLNDYRDRWVQVTVCAEGFIGERCDNFEGVAAITQDPCDPKGPNGEDLPAAERDERIQQALETTGCPPPVQSRNPAAAGSIQPFIASSGQPQRPHPPGGDAAVPAGVPGGAVPVQPGAAPGG